MDTKNKRLSVRAASVAKDFSPGLRVDAFRENWSGGARVDGPPPTVTPYREGRRAPRPVRRGTIGAARIHGDVHFHAGTEPIASLHPRAAATDEVREITFSALSRALDADNSAGTTSFRVESMSAGTLHKWTEREWVKVIGGSAILGPGEKLQWVGARSPFVVTRLGAASIVSGSAKPQVYVILCGEDSEDLEVFSGGADSQRSLVAAALVHSKEELRRLSHRMVSVQEDERKRIALDLHDGLGQSLSLIKLCLENSGRLLAAGATSEAGEALRQLIPRVGDALSEVRRVSSELRPPILDDLGILATLTWFFREVQSLVAGVSVEAEIALQERDVPSRLHITIFRIVQEAFHNILKHAQATHVRVKLHRIDATLHLLIEDNGIGFDPDTITWTDLDSPGLGLLSMKERAFVSGGTYHLRSAQGEGTCIWATWACHLPE